MRLTSLQRKAQRAEAARPQGGPQWRENAFIRASRTFHLCLARGHSQPGDLPGMQEQSPPLTPFLFCGIVRDTYCP